MRDRPSVCSGNVSEFHRATPLLVQEGRAGQPRPQWTTAQDDPQRDATRSHAAMRGNCTTGDEPGTASYYMLVQPEDSLVLFVTRRRKLILPVYYYRPTERPK